jgi:RNA polymerase sigma-70 factor (ECF subfamily)
VQETFVDAWRHLARFDQSREFGPWLRTICRNRTLKFMRDRLSKRQRELALVDEALMATMPEEDPLEGRLTLLRRCLAQLDDAHRLLLQQRYADDVPVQNLAQQMGKSPNAISMILLRLKGVLLRCMHGAIQS